MLGLLRASSEALLVVNDEPAAAADALTLLRRLDPDFAISRFRLLASMTLSAAEGRALHERLLRQSESLGGVSLDYVGAIPLDDSLRRAVQRRRTVCEVLPRSRAANAYRELAEKVDAWPLHEGRSAAGIWNSSFSGSSSPRPRRARRVPEARRRLRASSSRPVITCRNR